MCVVNYLYPLTFPLLFCEVESYDPASDHWTLRPSLNVQKGSLGGATLNNKIFAIGGGNGVESFADVEMLDLDVGRWIGTRSMLQKVIHSISGHLILLIG